MELHSEQKERIAQKAKQFVERWTRKHNIKECRESQTFMNEFFGIFDIDRFGSDIHFEYEISKDGNNKRIDVFWPGIILIENKTPGENLNKAFDKQVRTYLDMLKKRDLPKFILINNFRVFKLYPIKNEELALSECESFYIENLPERIHLFYYFLAQKHEKIIKESIENPAEKMIKETIYKVRYGILILASSLSIVFGYIISDGQPRAALERVTECVMKEPAQGGEGEPGGRANSSRNPSSG